MEFTLPLVGAMVGAAASVPAIAPGTRMALET
jgi:hypothetical protein